MRVLFFGTPEFAVPSLRSVAGSQELVGVVSQPLRRSGRGRHLQSEPVPLAARELSIPLLTPTDLSDDSFRRDVAKLRPDIMAVVAYGRILPSWILKQDPHGAVNVHASLLPAYRGAAPIQRAIMAGETTTGVTTMALDEGMDTGPIYDQRRLEISPADNAGSLSKRLSVLGSQLLQDTLEAIAASGVEPKPQTDTGASLAPPLTREELHLDLTLEPRQLIDHIRALSPKPGSYVTLKEKRLKLFKAEPGDEQAHPSTIALDPHGQLILAGRRGQTIRLLDVQFEGGKRMAAEDFVRGHSGLLGQTIA